VTRVTRGCDILHHYTVNLEYCEKLKSQQWWLVIPTTAGDMMRG
jgi:hypothetical protein